MNIENIQNSELRDLLFCVFKEIKNCSNCQNIVHGLYYNYAVFTKKGMALMGIVAAE